jgi:Ca2+:H+ antiporter
MPYRWGLALGIFVPVSWIVWAATGSGMYVFAAAGIGIIPLAWFMGLATEELGKHSGPGIGGLLNATFGNATELIIALVALANGLHEVVKASLTGSIIGNVLLVLGLSMVAGGIRHKRQTFSREASGVQTTMLVLAVIGLVMPALYVLSTQSTGGTSRLTLEEMSVGIAAILLAAYVLGLIFSLRTHRDLFNPMSAVREKPKWSIKVSLAVLFIATILVAVESELLVDSLEAAKEGLHLTDLFVGVIIIAIIGNAAEHGSAIAMARRDKMELSVSIAMSSTAQIALFVGPFLVVASMLTPVIMTLNFEIFELVAIALSAAVLSAVLSDGQSNWYEGTILVLVYLIMAVAFFFHP